MSESLLYMTERATKYIKENIKSDINEDEVTGELYQEFSEPTKAELQILEGLQIGERVVLQGMIDRYKRLNGKEGYIVDVDMNMDYPIIVNLRIEDDIFVKYYIKRKNLRSVKNA